MQWTSKCKIMSAAAPFKALSLHEASLPRRSFFPNKTPKRYQDSKSIFILNKHF